MNNKMVFGQYINGNSWIHKLDPRTKLLTLFLMMIGVFLINNIYVLLGCFAFFIILVLTTKISIIKFIQSFKTIVMLMVLTTIFQIIFNRTGEVIIINDYTLSFDFTLTWLNIIISIGILLFYFVFIKYVKKCKVLTFVVFFLLIMVVQYYVVDIWPIVNYNISIYDEGIKTALLVLLRILNLLTLSGLLTFTTKSTDLNNGIEGLFGPIKFMKKAASVLGMMISIAIRFIPTLINESSKILRAQGSRGVDFEDGRLKDKIVQIVSLLIPMIAISYKKAYDLADAMEARGYIPGEPRTKISELKYQIKDYLCYAFLICFLGAIITFKILGVL